MWVDTHAHLTDPKFDPDRAETIQRACHAEIEALIEIGESPESWAGTLALAESHPFIYAALGIHPHYAHLITPERWKALETQLERYVAHPKVVAIGELGLDYFRMQNTPEEQARLVRWQMDLAGGHDKPVVLHCREAGPEEHAAHADLRAILATYYPDQDFSRDCPARPNGVVHCFSGVWADAQDYLSRRFLLGFDGPVTYPSAKALHTMVQRMPLERVVLETDSPYLPPQLYRGQRNEPAYLPWIAEAIGALKRKTREEVAWHTTANAKRLFRIK